MRRHPLRRAPAAHDAHWRRIVACVTLSFSLVACRAPRVPDRTEASRVLAGSEATYIVPGFTDRDYILRVPRGYNAATPVAVVFGFHGGGGRNSGFVRTGCSGGDESSPQCLSALADREGFALVLPNGVDAPGIRGRSWNAGGGRDGFRCVGGQACATMSDDVAYFDALLTEVRRAIAVDDTRIFAIGISNGAAMSHRLACERSNVVAAIAAVGGANQASAAPGCMPTRAVPVLHIHGTGDRCWGYDGSSLESLCSDDSPGMFMNVDRSMAFWRTANGCTGTSDEALPDSVADGTSTTRVRGMGCRADTEHLRVTGGGHTWPGGWQYLGADRIGPVSRDFNGNAVIWDFLKAHPR